MSDLSSYEERQEDEVEFLQAVFPNPGDFQDLRLHDTWKIYRPPEIVISLDPQKSMGGNSIDQRPLSVKLHTKYTTDYPDSVPALWLEDPQGLTPDLVKELEGEIRKLAKERIGEVMMLEIAQHVMSFLHKHDRPPISLHEEMVMRQKEEEKKKMLQLEAEEAESRLREIEEHRKIVEEIEIKRKEAEIWKQERLGLNSDEDSYDQNSSADESISSPIRPAPPVSLTPSLHSSNHLPLIREEPSQEVYTKDMPKFVRGRRTQKEKKLQIKRGKLLGDSMSRGYSVYVGMDSESGELLAIYEWSFQLTKKMDTRRVKQITSIQQQFETFMSQGVCHSSLIQFLDMTLYRSPDIDNRISIELVMEYVGGGSVSSFLRNPDSGPTTGSTLSYYSKQLLEAVDCLHSKGIVHNDIRPSVVYFDTGGGIKLGGSNIIKRLSDLYWAVNAHLRHPPQATPTVEDESTLRVWPVDSMDLRGGKKGDIFKLGVVLLCLATGKLEIKCPPTIPEHLPPSLRDFIAKCVDMNEQRRFPAHELLHHPFIAPSPYTSQQHLTSSCPTSLNKHIQKGTRVVREGPMHFQRSDSIFGSPLKSSFMCRSRLETEFEELEVLGSGGFGDVIMVRHHLDARLYALKRIQTTSDSKIMNRITREVELLSQMNHENVVRYYNAWIETYTEEEYKKHSGTYLESEGYSGNSESGLENEQVETSIEFQNETSEESFGSDLSDGSTDTDSDSFQSANEEVEEDSFISFELSQLKPTISNGKDVFDKNVKTHGKEEDGVFMDTFSDSSAGGDDECNTILGKLETQVLNLSLSRFRIPPAESSDTVVFADSSTVTSKPVPIEIKERKKDRKKLKPSGQIQFLYIQMEYCENETLRKLIDSGDLHTSDDKVWRLFREIVEGLEHIHSKGMIHRDLKPGNIFLNSSGHIKIGDFGLAISYKHPINKQNSSLMQPAENLHDGETGLVGTAMYMAPELQKNQLKYTQKVDTYSLGIIFFEMIHPPLSTAMERYKMLQDIRRPDIIFPSTFDVEKAPNKKEVIKLLLNHNPHERPSSKQLLQSPLLPLKMEDEELQEVLVRTLQSTNSTRYRYLIDELFAQDGSRVSDYAYFLDPQDNKRRSHSFLAKGKFVFRTVLLRQLVYSRLTSIFTHHGASSFIPPLLGVKGALFSEAESVAQFMDRSGTIVVLPHDHRVPFARYVCHQDITYLKRYCMAPVFRESRVLSSHPREYYECQFDIVSPGPGSLIPDAEVMYVVTEIISEIPGLQNFQFSVWINHTSLLTSILKHCSIPEEKHDDVKVLLHKMMSGSLKSTDLLKKLGEKKIQLSPLASKTLLKFVSSEVAFDSREIHILLEPLLKDKSTGIASYSSQAWQEITNVISLFRQFGAKEQVYLHLGLTHGAQHFSGVIFQFVDTSASSNITGVRKNRQSKITPLAIGGRYDKLLEAFRRPGQQRTSSVSVVGVTVMNDVMLGAVVNAYHSNTCQVSKCSVLVCWLGRESLQKECLGLVRDLWAQGISADILYESMEKDNIEDIQEFCREFKIPHLVVLGDKAPYFEWKQIKLRILERNKVIEKLLTFTELIDFLQQRHNTVERSDSTEIKEPIRASGSHLLEGQSTAMPQVNVNVVTNGKLSGHLKRRYHDQTVNKLLPLFQKFSIKQQLEAMVVDLKSDVLCSLAAEINKVVAGNESDFSSVAKAVIERHNDCNKKYITKICEAIEEIFSRKKPTDEIYVAPVVFLYSHSAEFCQVILKSIATN